MHMNVVISFTGLQVTIKTIGTDITCVHMHIRPKGPDCFVFFT